MRMFAPDEADSKRIVAHLRRVVALGALVLLGATWKVWTPQQVFPRVPLLEFALSIPESVEWIGTGLLPLSLAAAMLAPTAGRLWRAGLVVYSLTTIAMVVFDQQRLQTWAYQFALMGLVLALLPPRRAVALSRLFIISIYFHSGLSKISLSFVETTGPLLVAGLLKALRVPFTDWWPTISRGFEVLLPISELCVAFLLFFPRYRRTGLFASFVMHIPLIMALSALGLNHKPGVLLWNGYFLLQNVVLFGPVLRRRVLSAPAGAEAAPAQPSAQMAGTTRFLPGERIVTGLATAAILLPLLEPFGKFDHWPSWAVYAGGLERVRVYVAYHAKIKLPPDLQRHTTEPLFADGFGRVLIDRWALDVLDAPIYPEDRFQLGVAYWIARHVDHPEDVRIALDSRAGRWTNLRTSRVIVGPEGIEDNLELFWWNGLPRLPEAVDD